MVSPSLEIERGGRVEKMSAHGALLRCVRFGAASKTASLESSSGPAGTPSYLVAARASDAEFLGEVELGPG